MNTARGEIEIPYEASPEWIRLWSGESDEFDFVWSGGKVHMGIVLGSIGFGTQYSNHY
jgi:hypothetical protein